MAMSEKERLYHPSEWSKRYNKEEMKEYFMKFCTEVTENARKTIKCELNVPYDTTERTKYDIYGTDLPADAPILIFIHGGYWQEFSKDLSGFTVPLFVKNKVKVIISGYDLCPNVKIGDIVEEIKSMVEQVLKYAFDSGCKSVWISGHSAGAHLAAALLHDEKWIERMAQQEYFALLKQIVLIAGIYNIRPLIDVPQAAPLNLTDKEVEELSWPPVDKPKNRRIRGLRVIVTVGDCDSPKFVEESKEYAQKIIPFVDNVEHLLLPDIDHFNIVENLLDPNFALTKSMLNNL